MCVCVGVGVRETEDKYDNGMECDEAATHCCLPSFCFCLLTHSEMTHPGMQYASGTCVQMCVRVCVRVCCNIQI